MKTLLQTVVITLVIGMSGCRLGANFAVIEEGKAYRSAQLTGEELEKAIRHFGIKSIINLQGAFPGRDWYDAEAAVAAKYGVELVSIEMDAKAIPHRKNLLQLLDALRDLPRPMLIHCYQGADRTGEAAAIYQMEYMGKSKEEALKMLSDEYLHVELFAPAKRYFIRKVYQGQEWAYTHYDPCAHRYEYYDQPTFCGQWSSPKVEIPAEDPLEPYDMPEEIRRQVEGP